MIAWIITTIVICLIILILIIIGELYLIPGLEEGRNIIWFFIILGIAIFLCVYFSITAYYSTFKSITYNGIKYTREYNIENYDQGKKVELILYKDFTTSKKYILNYNFTASDISNCCKDFEEIISNEKANDVEEKLKEFNYNINNLEDKK